MNAAFCELTYLRRFSTDPANDNVLHPTAQHGTAVYVLVVRPLRNVQNGISLPALLLVLPRS